MRWIEKGTEKWEKSRKWGDVQQLKENTKSQRRRKREDLSRCKTNVTHSNEKERHEIGCKNEDKPRK